jgi:hypothetical protein
MLGQNPIVQSRLAESAPMHEKWRFELYEMAAATAERNQKVAIGRERIIES